MANTYEYVKKNGEYLGFDSMKGYIYSVFSGFDEKGREKYSVCALYNGDVCILITYSVNQ